MRPVILTLLTLVLAAPLPAQSIRLDVSVDELEARARRDSCDAAAHYNLAVGYMSRRQWARADSTLARATALDPQLAVAWLARSIVFDRDDNHWRDLRRRGDSASTAELRLRASYSRRAYLIDPLVDLRILGAVSQFSNYGDAVQYYYGRDFRRFDDGVRIGTQGLVEADYARSLDGLNMATIAWTQLGLARDSLPEWLIFYHGLAAAHTNQWDLAIADIGTLVARNVNAEKKDTTRAVPLRTNEYRYVLATLHQRAAHRDAAVSAFQEVAGNDLGNFMTHVQLARIFEAERNWPEAIRERRAAADINADDHTVTYDLGAALARSGQWAPAEEALLRARDMQPKYPRTWHALGVVEQQLGKTAEAREAFNRFLAIAPSRMTTQITDARTRLAQLP